jgi:hypothetical protein
MRRNQRQTMDAPMATTNRPESRLSQGKSVSGAMNCAANSVISPSANTPAVWVMVVESPRKSACQAVPRAPTR